MSVSLVPWHTLRRDVLTVMKTAAECYRFTGASIAVSCSS